MARRINLKGCKDAILEVAGDVLSQSDADELVKAIDQRIRNIQETDLVNVEDRIAEIGEELVQEIDLLAQVQKRNALFTVKAMRALKKSAAAYNTPYEGLLAYLEDSRKAIQGANRGVNSVIEGWKSKYLGTLKARLVEAGVFEDFRKDMLEEEIFMEFYAPGSSGSKKAAKIRDILFAIKQDAVEKQNLFGGFIRFRPEHVKRQTYNPNLIKKNFGPSRYKKVVNFNRWLKEDEYLQTFENWKNFIKPLLDPEETFKDSDPDKFLRGVFDGLMSGKHGPLQKSSGAEVNTKFYRTGSLAKKISTQRLLHFKDGPSAYKAHKAFSSEPLSAGILSEIEHASHNIGLMQMLGPNPESTLSEVINQLEYDLSRSGKEMPQRELDRNRRVLMTSLKFLNNEAKVPDNPTMHTAIGSVISVLSMAKLGKLMLFALPDRALLQSTLTRNGISGMQAFASALNILPPKTKAERLRLIMMGAEIKSFINTANSRFSTGAEAPLPSALHTSQKHFFNFTGINALDDIGTRAVMQALTRHAGSMADRPWGRLIPEFRQMLSNFGFTPKEWDAIRATSYAVDETTGAVKSNWSPENAWVTADQFENIPESVIDDLLTEEGITVSPNNRKRKVAELENKYYSWLSAQRDEGVLMPGSKEHRLAAFGTQAGTGMGSLTRLLMTFKSFPITIYTKILKREMQGTGAKNFKEWMISEKNSNFHTTQLIAFLTIAGYLSLAIDDVIQGKHPRGFTNDKGDIDSEIALKTLKESFLRGGAGGLFADMLLREYDNSYNSVARALGGPALSEFERMADIAEDFATGEPDYGKLGSFVKGNTPWINLFYVKPALDYLVFYNIQEALDENSLRKMERQQRMKHNTRYWLPPSEVNAQLTE